MTAPRSLSASLQHLGRTLLATETAALTDAELVGRFVERRDEVAFGVLVRRYGPVVFGVCRRVLRHEQDAEDAFQATFLVFARRAATVQRAGAVGNWLYGVARNVARKAKAARLRRTAKEREATAGRRAAAPAAAPGDLREVLDAELGALPDKYRSPIVLCDLMGLTTQEAAAEVGCPSKTLGTRLLRGRSLLASRLTRRGVAVPAVALVATLASEATAGVPPRLVQSTAHTVIGFVTNPAAAVPPAVAALTEGVSDAMRLFTFKAAAVLACGYIAATALAGGPLWHHLHAAPSTSGVITAEAPRSKPPAASRSVSDPLIELHDLFRSLFHGGEDVAFTSAAGADDKKEEKDKTVLSGAWEKKEGETKIVFEQGSLKLYPHGDNKPVAVLGDYTADKEGLVKVKITGIEANEEVKKMVVSHLPVGTEFSFKWKVKNGTAALGDVKAGKDVVDTLKSHLEGDYAEKK